MKKKAIREWAFSHSVSVEIASAIELYIMKKNKWSGESPASIMGQMNKIWYQPSTIEKERIVQIAFRHSQKKELMWDGPIQRKDALK